MNELYHTFHYKDFEIRTIIKNNKLWFVLKDICLILEIKNSKDVSSRIYDREKNIIKLNTKGGIQKITIINESGLYSILFSGRKQEAHQFKQWIISDVLSSSIKTDTHKLFNLPQTLPEALRLYANEIEKNVILQIENKQQQVVIEEQKPKVDYYDVVTTSQISVDMNVVAKTLDM